MERKRDRDEEKANEGLEYKANEDYMKEDAPVSAAAVAEEVEEVEVAEAPVVAKKEGRARIGTAVEAAPAVAKVKEAPAVAAAVFEEVPAVEEAPAVAEVVEEAAQEVVEVPEVAAAVETAPEAEVVAEAQAPDEE